MKMRKRREPTTEVVLQFQTRNLIHYEYLLGSSRRQVRIFAGLVVSGCCIKDISTVEGSQPEPKVSTDPETTANGLTLKAFVAILIDLWIAVLHSTSEISRLRCTGFRMAVQTYQGSNRVSLALVNLSPRYGAPFDGNQQRSSVHRFLCGKLHASISLLCQL
jgi:hypothetical protein